ncbi:MAG TPA: hemolysin family protein [Opitutaceae bacterium]|nr:hemolysin family protein [Opitutaceae bacterium]
MLSIPIELLILALLVLANGVLAMAETAVVSARKSRLRKLARAGNRGAAKALALGDEPARFLELVEFWLTLSGMIAGVLAGAELAGEVAAWLGHWPSLAPQAVWLSLVIVTFGLTSFMLLFGELVPKRIAASHPERVASWLAGLVAALAWIMAPLLKLFELATDGITRLLRIKPRPLAETVGDDEVRALIEQGLHAGVFERAEQEMVEGVLALDQLAVTAIMTPRPKIVFLNLEDTEETNWRKIVTSGHSYFPVYQANRDQVVGLVAVKALWAHAAIGLPTTLKNLLLPPLFVPENQKVLRLLEQFRTSGRHIAIVTDEFGAVQGLVTLIDVMEAIVGEIPERGQAARPEAKRRDDGSWLIDATMSISELKSLLAVDQALPHEASAAFQTLGGFVVTEFGRIPAAGDRFTWGRWRFEVVDMDRRRVDKVLVSPVETPPPSAADETRA